MLAPSFTFRSGLSRHIISIRLTPATLHLLLSSHPQKQLRLHFYLQNLYSLRIRGDDERHNDPSSQRMAAGIENLFTPGLGNSFLLRWSRLPKVPPTPCTVWYRTSRRPVQFNGSPTSMPTQHNIDLLSPSVTSFKSTIAERTGCVQRARPCDAG
jgi:hypothetical protein